MTDKCIFSLFSSLLFSSKPRRLTVGLEPGADLQQLAHVTLVYSLVPKETLLLMGVEGWVLCG